MLTFFDLETTDKIPSRCEILTAYFLTVDENYQKIDSIYLEFRPLLYRYESFKIHGISKQQADKFPEKEESLRRMLVYMKKYKNSLFVCQANKKIFGVTGFFDWQVIRMELLSFSQKAYYWFMREFYYTKIVSTHTLAKKFIKLDKYDLKSMADHCGFKFKHHDCVEDTKATLEVFKRIVPNHFTLDEIYEVGSWHD